MARNTLEAVFGALGAGVRGYGRDTARRREEEQAEIARQDELARTLAERQLRIFQSGLEEAAPATQRAQNVGQFGQMAQAAQGAMPAPMSAVGRALQSVGSGMQTDIQRGRRVDIGGTEYVQPFSRTAQGIEERDLQRQAAQTNAEREALRLRDEAQARQRMAEIAAQGQNQLSAIRETARLRPEPTPSPSTTTGRDRLPALPTTIRTAEELRRMTPDEVRQLRPVGVYSAAQAPLLAADAKDPLTAVLAGGGNIMANAREQAYAQYVASVSDAVARMSEVGVLTNQDIARFRAQTLFLPGDSDEMKMRKYENLKSWADYIVAARSAMNGEMTPEQAESLRQQAQQLGTNNERELFRSWAQRNPRQGNEDDADYVARFRESVGGEGRGGR